MIGKTIAHYKIIDKIGSGGMGEVYLAEDSRLGRNVALKFLPAALAQDPDAKARFIHEARAASALEHPNVCTVHDIGEDADGRMFMVMPHYQGSTLKEIMARGGITEAIPAGGRAGAGGQLPVADAIEIAAQAARGLAAAHAKGIIHRDVKPANLMVTDDGMVKVLDFGIAKLADSQARLTKTGSTVGTVAYMSPEQATGQEVDARTDIWSLGVILYEMLAGELPFRGEHPQGTIYAILHQEPQPIGKARSGLPEGMASMVVTALAKKREDRYQTMKELLEDLAAVAGGLKPVQARARMGRSRIRRFGLRVIAVTAVAAAMALALGLDIGRIRSRLLAPGNGPSRAIRLAVLPFANLSHDPGQEYFSDGLTQEMITRLGRLHPQGLSVIARTSVMRYKRSNAAIDQIGRDLNVDFVLEGSAQREGNRVKVNTELIRVEDQTQLWSDSLEREMSGILALQGEVAGKVASALALKLLPAERDRLAAVSPIDPEAYEAYLKGTHYRQMLTRGGLETAENYFNLAREKDPKYAAAWAGIAGIWTARQQMGVTPSREAFLKAREAAHMALSLDPGEIEARRVMAGILTWNDWNWRDADRAWGRVFEINPDYPPALSPFSHFLMVTGRCDEALTKSKRALELDPFDSRTLSFHSVLLLFARRYDEAIAAARKALKMQSDAPVARTALIGALFMKSRFDDLMAIERSRWAKDKNLLEALEQGYDEGGYPYSQKQLADTLAVRYGTPGGVTAYTLANFYARAGQGDRVIEWLERAYDAGDGNMPYIGLPVFDLVRNDPRFQLLRKRIGLPTGATI